MEVRGKDGEGPLLFEWDPDTQTIDLIRKNMFYRIQLNDHAYCVREECSKYECKRSDSTKNKN